MTNEQYREQCEKLAITMAKRFTRVELEQFLYDEVLATMLDDPEAYDMYSELYGKW